MKKILLIDPPGWQGAVNGNPAAPNNGIAYLVAVLKKTGWDIAVLDMNNTVYSDEETESFIADFKPDIIGISCKTATYKAAEKIASGIKKWNFNGKIIFGGPHITLNADEIFRSTNADILFEGDGETDFPILADFIISQGDVPEFHYGRLLKNANGADIYKRTELQPIPENIFPDYSLFPDNVKEYLKNNYPLFSSRGCPYKCIYCSVPLITGAKWRARSVDSIVAEIKYAMENWKICGFDIVDDSWNVDMNRCKEMCRKIIADRLEVSCAFPNGIRADRVDTELADLMKQIGCRIVAVGFENTDQEVFTNINKGSTVEKIVAGINILKKAKLPVSAYFIVGLPFDTYQKEIRNIKFIRSLHIKASFNLLVPYPHTKVFEFISENGKWLAPPENSMHFCNFLEEIPITFEYENFSEKEIRKAFIIANISSGTYWNLSKYAPFTLAYYWQISCVIFKYAPQYLPEFIGGRIKNIVLRIFKKILKNVS